MLILKLYLRNALQSMGVLKISIAMILVYVCVYTQGAHTFLRRTGVVFENACSHKRLKKDSVSVLT